ncbi:hypothetical protein ACZ90_40445 [Streptomyces albus subsp. albus]|nr:hypothetical protein ACZ90_40445 [Streptomyces albus subsp. albus]
MRVRATVANRAVPLLLLLGGLLILAAALADRAQAVERGEPAAPPSAVTPRPAPAPAPVALPSPRVGRTAQRAGSVDPAVAGAVDHAVTRAQDPATVRVLIRVPDAPNLPNTPPPHRPHPLPDLPRDGTSVTLPHLAGNPTSVTLPSPTGKVTPVPLPHPVRDLPRVKLPGLPGRVLPVELPQLPPSSGVTLPGLPLPHLPAPPRQPVPSPHPAGGTSRTGERAVPIPADPARPPLPARERAATADQGAITRCPPGGRGRGSSAAGRAGSHAVSFAPAPGAGAPGGLPLPFGLPCGHASLGQGAGDQKHRAPDLCATVPPGPVPPVALPGGGSSDRAAPLPERPYGVVDLPD